MKILTEYKKSLKQIETEEIFDLLIFRPLGFVIMKIFYHTRVTPNFLTTLSLFLGIISSFLLIQKEWICMLYSAIFLILSNSFDCADGQLARAKKNGTKFGRVYDGLIDYIVYIFLYVAIAYSLSISTQGSKYIWFFGEMYYLWWIFVALAGASTSIQAIIFDNVRNEFTNYTTGLQNAFLIEEYKKYKNEFEEIKNQKGFFRKKLLYKLYFAYLNVQTKTAATTNKNISGEKYYEKNKIIIRLWGFTGSTTHLVLLIICILLQRLDIFVWSILIVFNLLTFILWIFQKSINKKLLDLKN